MKLFQIFRKKNQHFFSIESVFSRVEEAWPSTIKPQAIFLPETGIKFSNLLFLFRINRRNRKALFHVTGDAHYGVLALPRKRTLLTIHDCVFLKQETGIKRWLLKKILLDIPVWYCRYITTISNKTKEEILSSTGCDPEKIKVIPNPVSPVIYLQPKEFNNISPVLLFIGITPNKNFARVCEAIQNLDCRLQVIGKLSEEQESELKKIKVRYDFVHGISEAEVADKYAQADIILFPSLYEGFGLPVIEGFKAGRAVLTSNISPMKDIAEDAACLVDPTNVESIRSGIVKLIHDQPYREGLIQKGLEVVKKYQPDSIAEKYYKLYQEVYNKACVE